MEPNYEPTYYEYDAEQAQLDEDRDAEQYDIDRDWAMMEATE